MRSWELEYHEEVLNHCDSTHGEKVEAEYILKGKEFNTFYWSN